MLNPAVKASPRPIPKVLLQAKKEAVRQVLNKRRPPEKPWEKGPWDKGHWANRK